MFIWQISSEKIVFLSIGIIVLAVITFCLGVERGKRMVQTVKVAAVQLAQERVQAATFTSNSKTVSGSGPAVRSATYTIMTASYAKKDDAQKDAVRLKKAGFPVYIAQSGRFFVIKVGDFNDKAQADAAFSALKKNYGYTDIYIRTNK